MNINVWSQKKRRKDTEKKVKAMKYSRKLQNTKKGLFWNLFVDMINLHVALSMRVFADICKEAWLKRRIWINIESLVFVKELSVSLINCAQESVFLIRKQGKVNKKNVYLFQH